MTNSDIISNYYYNMVQSLNNFPLNKSSNQSTGSTTPCGPCKPEDTYELYYKNLKSYPFTVDMSNDNYLITKFSLPDGKVIVLTTDMRDPNNIISTFRSKFKGVKMHRADIKLLIRYIILAFFMYLAWMVVSPAWIINHGALTLVLKEHMNTKICDDTPPTDNQNKEP